MDREEIWRFLQQYDPECAFEETSSSEASEDELESQEGQEDEDPHEETSEPGPSNQTQMEVTTPTIANEEQEEQRMETDDDFLEDSSEPGSGSFHIQLELVSARSSDSFQSLERPQSQGMDLEDDFMEGSPKPGPSTSFHDQMDNASPGSSNSSKSQETAPSLSTRKTIKIPCNGLTLVAKKTKHRKSAQFNYWYDQTPFYFAFLKDNHVSSFQF